MEKIIHNYKLLQVKNCEPGDELNINFHSKFLSSKSYIFIYIERHAKNRDIVPIELFSII